MNFSATLFISPHKQLVVTTEDVERSISACDGTTSGVLVIDLGGQSVACKLRSRGLNEDDEILREKCALEAICKGSCQNVMMYFGFYETLTTSYLLMENIAGCSLDSWILDPNYRLSEESWETRLKIAMDICRGLRHIHDCQFSHNDINPANVMIKKISHTAVIIDFGASSLPHRESRLTKAGGGTVALKTAMLSKCGTHGYIAPERLKRSSLGLIGDQVADVFSFGIVFLELLSGVLVDHEEGSHSYNVTDEINLLSNLVANEVYVANYNDNQRLCPVSHLSCPPRDILLKMLMLGQSCCGVSVRPIHRITLSKAMEELAELKDMITSNRSVVDHIDTEISMIPVHSSSQSLPGNFSSSKETVLSSGPMMMDISDDSYDSDQEVSIISEKQAQEISVALPRRSNWPDQQHMGDLAELVQILSATPDVLPYEGVPYIHRGTHTFVIGDLSFDLEELDYGVSFRPFLVNHASANMCYNGAAVETNRCFFIHLGVATKLSPILLEAYFRVYGQSLMTQASFHHDVLDGLGGVIDVVDSVMGYAGFVDASILAYLWPIDFNGFRIAVLSEESSNLIISVFNNDINGDNSKHIDIALRYSGSHFTSLLLGEGVLEKILIEANKSAKVIDASCVVKDFDASLSIHSAVAILMADHYRSPVPIPDLYNPLPEIPTVSFQLSANILAQSDFESACKSVANSLQWGSDLRHNQKEVLKAIVLQRRDVIWCAGCNAGKSIVYYGPAILSSLKLLGQENTKILLLVPTNAIMTSIQRESKCYPIRLVTPGHEPDVKLSLPAALASEANLIVCHPSKLLSMCGIQPDGKPKWKTAAERLNHIRNLNRTLVSGSSIILVADEVHTYFTVPYPGFKRALQMIKEFLPNCISKVSCTATLVLGESSLTTVKSAFDMRPDTYMRVESSQRLNIQRLIVNTASHMDQKVFKGKGSSFISEYLVHEVQKLHAWALSQNGAVLIYAGTHDWATTFRDKYIAEFPGVPDEDIKILLGSRKQKPEDQEISFNAVDVGDASLLIATSVISMGATIRKLIAAVVADTPYCGVALEQIIGRIKRGCQDDAANNIGVVFCAFPSTSIESDFQNVSRDSLVSYEVDMARKRLLREIAYSTNCAHWHLDHFLPAFQEDGVPVEKSFLPCGTCIPCMYGTEKINVSRDAYVIFSAVKETCGLLPGNILSLLLTGCKIDTSLGSDYFEHIYKISEKSFYCYAALKHCVTVQVNILIQYLIFAGYLKNVDVTIETFVNNGRVKRAAVALTDKASTVLDQPAVEAIMIPLIRLPSTSTNSRQLSHPNLFGVDRNGKLIVPIHDEVNRDWHSPCPQNRSHKFSSSEVYEEATTEEQAGLDFFDRLDEEYSNSHEYVSDKKKFKKTSHFNFDCELLRRCKPGCECRKQTYRKSMSDKIMIDKNAAELESKICVNNGGNVDPCNASASSYNGFVDAAGNASNNGLQCFTRINDRSLEQAFQPDLLSAILGHEVPSDNIRSHDIIDLSDFCMPLHILLKAFYIDGSGETSKFCRRDGFALYTMRYFRDGDLFLFSSNNITHTGYNGESIMAALERAEMPVPSSCSLYGPRPCIRLTSKCGFPGCPAQRCMTLSSINRIDLTNFSSDTIANSPNLADYEVVFTQKIQGSEKTHLHDITAGSQNRTQLPYDPYNPHKSFIRDDKSKSLKVVIEPHKVAYRCDFNLLPSEKRPLDHLLRAPIRNIAERGAGQPTRQFTTHLHQNSTTLGSMMHTSAVSDYTLGQAKNDRTRELGISQSVDTPWRHGNDVGDTCQTPDMVLTRLQNLKISEGEVAGNQNVKAAAMMTQLGLSRGFIQHVGHGTYPHEEYTYATLYDFYSFVIALRHLNPKDSLMYMDCTMLGKAPTVSGYAFEEATIVENADQFGYHTIIAMACDKVESVSRSDSQPSVFMPDFEIHVHHPSKSGLPSSFITQVLLEFKNSLNRALGKLTTSITNPNGFPLELGPKVTELDFGLAESKSIKQVYNATIIIRERYHSKQISVRFLKDMERKHFLSAIQCYQLNKMISNFFAAKVESQALSLARSITASFEAFLSDQTPENQQQARLQFGNTVTKYLLNNSAEVCDYGRDHLTSSLNQGWGPRIESMNNVMKERYETGKNMAFDVRIKLVTISRCAHVTRECLDLLHVRAETIRDLEALEDAAYQGNLIKNHTKLAKIGANDVFTSFAKASKSRIGKTQRTQRRKALTTKAIAEAAIQASDQASRLAGPDQLILSAATTIASSNITKTLPISSSASVSMTRQQARNQDLSAFELMFTWGTSYFLQLSDLASNTKESYSDFQIKLPSVCAARLSSSDLATSDVALSVGAYQEHWLCEAIGNIFYDCGFERSTRFDKCYLRVLHTTLLTEDDVDEITLRNDPSITSDRTIPCNDFIVQHKCSPLVMNIAIHLPNTWASDEITYYSRAVVIMLNIDVCLKHGTGGSYLSFEAVSMELLFGNESICQYAVSEALVRSIQQTLSTNVLIIPPSSAWTFFHGSSGSRVLELFRMGIEMIGSLFLANTLRMTASSVPILSSSASQTPLQACRTTLSPCTVTVCVVLSIDLCDDNQQFCIIGISIVEKPITTIRYGCELDEIKKYAETLVSQVGGKDRAAIMSFCSDNNCTAYVLSIDEYRAHTVNAILEKGRGERHVAIVSKKPRVTNKAPAIVLPLQPISEHENPENFEEISISQPSNISNSTTEVPLSLVDDQSSLTPNIGKRARMAIDTAIVEIMGDSNIGTHITIQCHNGLNCKTEDFIDHRGWVRVLGESFQENDGKWYCQPCDVFNKKSAEALTIGKRQRTKKQND